MYKRQASSYSTESGINGENAAVLGIYMLPGANAMEVAKSVKADVYKRQVLSRAPSGRGGVCRNSKHCLRA